MTAHETTHDPGGVVTRMLLAIDRLHWDEVRSTLDEQVRLDYTSLFGGDVDTVPAPGVIAQWQGLLPGFDATQHLTGPVVTSADGDEARCRTTVRAHHVLLDGAERAQWVIAGQYDVRLRSTDDGWRITAITLEAHDQDGPLDLPERAAKRAETGSGGRAGLR